MTMVPGGGPAPFVSPVRPNPWNPINIGPVPVNPFDIITARPTIQYNPGYGAPHGYGPLAQPLSEALVNQPFVYNATPPMSPVGAGVPVPQPVGGGGGGGPGGPPAVVSDPLVKVRTVAGMRPDIYTESERPYMQGFTPRFLVLGDQNAW